MNRLELRRILVFLLFAFGVAWATGIVIYFNGGLVNSPRLGAGFTLATVLLATAYMGAPMLANILTRLVTREGFRDMLLRPRMRQGWPYWLLCWLVPFLLTILGMALYFVLFPQYFDPNNGAYRSLIQAASGGAQALPANLLPVIAVQIVAGVLIAPILNALPTFGEEFGWRAYLLPRLLPMGTRRALFVSGIIWGIWHWPVIIMGYEYGFNYPGFPWTGMLVFCVFTIALGVLLGWATLKSSSVWPGVIGHGAVNGIAQVVVFWIKGEPNLLIGPAINGLVGGMGFVIVALVILAAPRALSHLSPAIQRFMEEPAASQATVV